MIIKRISKQFSSCTEDLEQVRSFVASTCEGLPFSEAKRNEIVLAIDEACANVIRHGYKMSKQGKVCIEIEARNDYVIFVIKDTCKKIAENDLQPTKSEDLCKPGGLGLCLIHHVANSVRLLRHKGQGNWLELTVNFENK